MGLPVMSLPSAMRDLRVHVGVGLRAHDLRQAHDLALRVRDLEAHARGAGDGLDHADRHHRERAREVAREVHDLRALHADRGLDLVARDHRAGIGRDHLHLHVEVEELPLDQARGVLERLGGRALDVRLGRVEQRRAGGSGESGRSAKSGTCFSRTTRSLFGTSTGGISMRIGSCSSKTFFASSTFSSRTCAASLALLAVAARLDARARGAVGPLEPRAHASRRRAATTGPVKTLKAAASVRDQQQRAAGEAERRPRRSARARRPARRRARRAAARRGCAGAAPRARELDGEHEREARRAHTASVRRFRISQASTRR